MGNPREKGKIAHSEWSAIQIRHRNGESLASIARDYHCTAPAIRYIVKRQPLAAVEGGLAASDGGASARAAPKGQLRSETPRGTGSRTLQAPGQPAKRTGITLGIQKRITSEISYFLVALDAAVARGNDQNLLALHDATDRLMRASARIRIEIERSIDLGDLPDLAESARGSS